MICPFCHKEFAPRQVGQYTCGAYDCVLARKREARGGGASRTRHCPICGVRYFPKRKNQATCGQIGCVDAYRRAYHQAYYHRKRKPSEARRIAQAPLVRGAGLCRRCVYQEGTAECATCVPSNWRLG